MSDVPPLPEGYTLDEPKAAASAIPALPEGFKLDQPTPSPPQTTPDPNADKSVLEEGGTAAMRGLYTISQGIADASHALGYSDVADKTKPLYNKYMADHAPAVPSYKDIKNAHDAALYGASALGGVSPYAMAALGGALPGAASLVLPTLVGEGAASGGEEASQSSNATPASIATGSAIGGAESAIVPPFMRGGAGILSKTARAVLGGGAYGAATGATANVPEAVATGDPSAAIPSSDQIVNSAISGAIGLGAFGAAHAGAERVTGQGAAASHPDQDSAAIRLAQRIGDAADNNDLDLNNIKYDAPGGAKVALDTVHTQLAEDIKGLWSPVKEGLDESQATSVQDILDRSALDATIRTAKNKVKGVLSEDDIKTLSDAVGHSEEGRTLVDLVRQSNELTQLYQNGLKGGVSAYTDILNPLARAGRETGYQSSILHSLPIGGTKLGELLALYHSPALAAPLAIGYGAGRGIDALTGRRSTVATFVRQNSGTPDPINMQGATSLLRDRAQQQDAAASQKAFDQMMAQRQQDAIKSQKAFDAYTASQGDAAEQARLAAREQELRTQNRLDNNPGLGGYDKYIYDQTGIRPQEALRGVFELNRTGRITPQEFNSFFKSPHDLMGGNAGNHIVDMLDMMARKGQLPRDPEWQQPAASPDASANPPQSGTFDNSGGSAAYQAQAAGNQARITETQSRVAASEHTPETKQAINDAAATIGRTNNRQDAATVHDNVVQSLGHTPEAQSLARQELSPLVKQIRHATPEEASKATRRPLRDIIKDAGGAVDMDRVGAKISRFLEPLTSDPSRPGNALTRLRAQVYKAKAGINKPPYEGSREPDQAYLKAVADYHDKAAHNPEDPAVVRSYAALAKESVAQFKALGKGFKVETWTGDGEPYRNSKEMMRDVSDNQHLWFLPTDSAFGSGQEIAHPMLADTGLKTEDGHPLLVNDVFRIVHDIFGHTQHGFQFGPKGEYNAFREHAQMYSDAALPALASETLAQNAWVNSGPHLRRSDGSLPIHGEADFVPPSQRPFSDQKAYAFPAEMIARDPNIGREFVDSLYTHPEGKIAQGVDVAQAKPALHDVIPGFKGIAPFLTRHELELVTKRNAKTLVDRFTSLPSAEEMASVAYSGRAKRGWYNGSAKAILSIFGAEDAPRFAALLAALSPQTSVEQNLSNALNVWRGWIEADRPKDERSIMRILGENVEGDKGVGSVLPAWVPNSLRALIAEDGSTPTISGAKVTSFMANLLGEVNEVTNDTWIANYTAVDPEKWFKWQNSGSPDEIGNIAKKGTGYLAISALTRKAAEVLTKRTGETWTPAEVQETVWSWAKAVSEKAGGYDPSLPAGVRASAARRTGGASSAEDLVKRGDLTHDEINSTPDFEKLFVRDTYARILDMAGYGDHVDNLKYTLEDRQADNGGNRPGGSPFSAEGSGVSQTALIQHLTRAAKRLDALKSGTTDTGRAANAADLSVGTNPAEFPALQAIWAARGRQTKVQDGKLMLVSPTATDQPRYQSGPAPVRETAPTPEPRAYTDPEGRQGAANFVAGVQHPDGTTKGLTTPQIRAVAKSIARLVEGTNTGGENGVYTAGSNSIRINSGLPENEHSRVLGHETGHAIEALSGVAARLGFAGPERPEIVSQLQELSRLERPHLWADDAKLVQSFDRPAKDIHEYRNRLDELFADAFRHYMTAPAETKKVAPVAARFMRSIVNPSNIGKVIAFTSVGGLALPGIIAQALAPFSSGGDQEDA